MKSFLLRQLKEIDITAAADLLYRGYNDIGEEWTKQAALDHVTQNSFSKEFCFVAVEKDKMVGLILAFPLTREDGTAIFIDSIVVEPAMRGKGIGSSLWDIVIVRAKESGLIGIHLMANPNWQSYKWYKKMKFNETGWVEMRRPIDK